MKRSRFVVALVLLLAVVACGRHVVLDPETVDRVNERAWTVKSEPRRVQVNAADAASSP